MLGKNGIAAFPCQAAHRVRIMPEIPEGLPLNDIKQYRIRDILHNANYRN
jgi:hypothetical protein